jgi:hypothetical protein
MPAYRRAELSSKATKGPALVIDYGSTTLVPAGWRFLVDKAGNLVVRVSGSPGLRVD